MRANRLAFLLCFAVVCASAAACGGGSDADAAPRPDAHIPAGQYNASWTVNGMSGQAACDSVGATNVSVTIINPNNQGEGDSFACGSAMGVSQEHTPDTYTVKFDLKGSGETLASVTAPGTTIINDGEVATVPPVDFALSTTGGFKLMLDANAPGPNCQPETATPLAGAGITEWQFELRFGTVGGTCVPTDFVVGDGATSGTTGGTFTLACPGPTVLPCFENDQLITFDGLAPGTYVLDAKGFEGANACYIKAIQDDIVGGDVIDDLHAVLVTLDAANPACISP